MDLKFNELGLFRMFIVRQSGDSFAGLGYSTWLGWLHNLLSTHAWIDGSMASAGNKFDMRCANKLYMCKILVNKRASCL